MPSDSHGLPPSSFLSDQVQERQIGFWKTDGVPDNYGVKDGKLYVVGGSSMPLMSSDSHTLIDAPNLYLNQDSENKSMGGSANIGQRHVDNNNRNINKGDRPNFGMDHLKYNHHENGLFSSSLSDLFSRKLRLSANNKGGMYGHSVGTSQYEEEEPFESIEEIEAQTIGNLLPDDDDLLSGVTDGLDCNKVQPDDVEELDFFSSVGGMELGEDGGETQLAGGPSRTLFVRNINSSVEDSELRILFEQYGEIQSLYTACKQRGFVMISYYDIRAARRAMQALQDKPLRRRKLDIHYSIPKDNHSDKEGTVVIYNLDSSISNDEVGQVFGVYGEVKEIREGSGHKTIEFYDIRAAESALRESDMAGKQMSSSKRPFPDETSALLQMCSPPARGHGSLLAANKSFPSMNMNMIGVEHNQLKYDFDFRSTPANYHPHSLPDGLTNTIMASRQFSRRSLEPNNDNAFGPSSCSPHHQFMWNPQPQAQAHNMMYSPSLMNAPSHMAKAFLHVNHHVGSAPSVNPPSIWDRRDTFHPGSLGNMNMNFVSQTMFPPRMDPSKTIAGYQNQNGVMFPGSRGGQVIFDSPSRTRRNEGNSNQPDNKKQFELDLDRIMRGEDRRTTLMIKNIPNKYTSKMLLAAIDERHRGTYDFIYLPIDFKNKCNVGYAFINMTEPSLIIPFYQAFNGKKWEKFNSEKVASIAYARIQGKAALIAHFQNSSLMNEDKRCRPILFHTDGPNAGDQVPFPMGVNVRSRVTKNRSNTNEEGGSQSSNSSSGSTKDFE